MYFVFISFLSLFCTFRGTAFADNRNSPYIDSNPSSSNYSDFEDGDSWRYSLDTSTVWPISRGQGVVVAVIDEGIDYTHESLNKSLWRNSGEMGIDLNGDDKSSNGKDDDLNGFIDDYIGWNFVSGTNIVKPKFSFESHGTHVAGIISGNNLVTGFFGIAPEANLMPLKVFDTSNRLTDVALYRAIAYAVDNGADIINISLNLDIFVDSQLLTEALTLAEENGVLVVNSAGNDSLQDPPRSRFDSTLKVASLFNNRLSDDTNWGTRISLAAPSSVRSTINNNKYLIKQGSSMAAALVSGAAAILISTCDKLKSIDLIQIFESSSAEIDSTEQHSKFIGSGRLDLASAVEQTLNECAVIR